MKMEDVRLSHMALSEIRPESPKARLSAVAFLVAAIVWLLVWYGDTAQSIAAKWQHSQTFAYGYFVVPTSLWLIWRRRSALTHLTLQPNSWVLPFIALAGFAWLIAELAGVVVVQQYALVLMIGLLVWAIAGNAVARELAFPLCFLLFAVPFGEVLIPPLTELTANFTVFALSLSGVPVYREGLYFVTPTGSWSIVDSCSGLNFLITCATGGTLYAYLRYRTLLRRAIFVAAAMIVPIVANWMRTYLIVILDHATNKKFSIATDHILYGWLFFAALVLLLFWIGSYWREDLGEVPATLTTRFPRRGSESLNRVVAAATATALLTIVWPATASWLGSTQPHSQTVLQAPSAGTGWKLLAENITRWTPRFVNPTTVVNQSYTNTNDGRRAGLFIAHYRNQQRGTQLISSVNRLVSADDREWRGVAESRRIVTADDKTIVPIASVLRGPDTHLLVWQWYWVDGQYTVNPYWAKLLQAKSRALGGSDDGAAVIVYTDAGGDPRAASQTLQDFVVAMLPGIARSLEHAR